MEGERGGSPLWKKRGKRRFTIVEEKGKEEVHHCGRVSRTGGGSLLRKMWSIEG